MQCQCVCYPIQIWKTAQWRKLVVDLCRRLSTHHYLWCEEQLTASRKDSVGRESDWGQSRCGYWRRGWVLQLWNDGNLQGSIHMDLAGRCICLRWYTIVVISCLSPVQQFEGGSLAKTLTQSPRMIKMVATHNQRRLKFFMNLGHPECGTAIEDCGPEYYCFEDVTNVQCQRQQNLARDLVLFVCTPPPASFFYSTQHTHTHTHTHTHK